MYVRIKHLRKDRKITDKKKKKSYFFFGSKEKSPYL